MEYEEELIIIVEEYPMFDSEDNMSMGQNVIINGDRVRNNGSMLRSVLEHLGYVVEISYH